MRRNFLLCIISLFLMISICSCSTPSECAHKDADDNGKCDVCGGSCTANRGCDGVDHKAHLTDRYFDYVVVQPGSGALSSAAFLEDMETVMNFFREANSNVKFVVLVPYAAYGTIGSLRPSGVSTKFFDFDKYIAAY